MVEQCRALWQPRLTLELELRDLLHHRLGDAQGQITIMGITREVHWRAHGDDIRPTEVPGADLGLAIDGGSFEALNVKEA